MTAPGWFADPTTTHELRYFDGTTWTEHVSDQGTTAVDPLPASGGGSGAVRAMDSIDRGLSFGEVSSDKVQAQVARSTKGAAVSAGTGDIFSEPILVVNQKAKLLELTNEYSISDAEGRKIGAVKQVGQSGARKALRLVSNLDQFLKVHLDVVDHAGQPVLRLTRPGKLLKSTVIVERPGTGEIGRLVQENAIGKIRFAMMVGEQKWGSINAENWRAWNFSIRDHTETEVARITKTWEGLAKAAFTTADNYVVQIHRPLEDPLRSLVVAAAVSVDTALKQNDSGGVFG
ncbi:MAG: phospholipid scramblase-related protein [Acidimicrobiales bacterium]